MQVGVGKREENRRGSGQGRLQPGSSQPLALAFQSQALGTSRRASQTLGSRSLKPVIDAHAHTCTLPASPWLAHVRRSCLMKKVTNPRAGQGRSERVLDVIQLHIQQTLSAHCSLCHTDCTRHWDGATDDVRIVPCTRQQAKGQWTHPQLSLLRP